MTSPNQTPKTSAEAISYAASHGVRLTATDRDMILKAQIAERKRLAALAQVSTSGHFTQVIQRFNQQLYPAFLSGLHRVGEVLMTFTQTVIVTIGIPLVLLLLLIVEQQRVVHGILLFEAEPALAAFAAWALVLLNLTLEMSIEFIESREGYHQNPEARFSLRLLVQNINYWLGLSRQWQQHHASPAQRYQRLSSLVTFAILALTITGSLRTLVVEQTTGTAWYEGLVYILGQGDLLFMMTLTSGLLFALTAVFAAQALSRYIALRCVEILAHKPTEQGTDDSAALEQVEISYILAKVAEAARKNQQSQPQVAAPTIAPQEDDDTRLSRPFVGRQQKGGEG